MAFDPTDLQLAHGYPSKLHQSRSISGITNKAIKALMKDASEVATGSQKYRKFVKLGTEIDAVTDFKAMKPADIHVNKRLFAVDGFVGDSILTLKTKDKTQMYRPSIMIADPKLKVPIKVVYMKTLD